MRKDQIIELAVKAALEWQQEQQRKQKKSRYDRRLRNTRLLLKNYRLLKDHCDNSVFNLQQAAEAEAGNAIDILDALNKCNGDIYIQSIKNSVSRTKIIINHIEVMLRLYKIYCDMSEKKEDQRRYRVMLAVYFEQTKIDDICKAENIDRRTYFRDTNDACEKLSALIFGFDGLSDVS